MTTTTATVASLAHDYNMEPYAVAAALDLGRDYEDHADLDDATAAEYREVLDLLAAIAESAR